MKVLPIIPAFNPHQELIETVKELILNNYKRIIIVDDGSYNKEVFSILNDLKECIILTHTNNMGKGIALKTAFKYYQDNLINDYQGVVTLDADGQHSTNDIINLSNVLIDNNLFILGTRLFNTKETPLRNKIGNRIAANIFKKIYHIYIKDTQTGLRAIPNYLIDLHINTMGERFEYEMNALINLIKEDYKILQIDIKTVYLEKSNKKSHFKVLKDSWQIYKIMLEGRK